MCDRERERRLEQEPNDAAADPVVAPAGNGCLPGGRIDRRRLLLVGGATAAVGLGTAAGLVSRRAAGAKAELATIPDRRVAMPPTTPRLVIARGPSPARNVEAALAKIGGMGKLILQGDVVLVKPNIGWNRTPAQAANTDPEVVAAVVRACLAAGAVEVIVCDVSCDEAARALKRSGIGKAAAEAGATVVMPGAAAKRSIEIPGKSRRWRVPEPFVRATKVINVPVAKHHSDTLVSASMKNWFGAIADEREPLHKALDESIVGLAEIFRPTLTVVDATRVLLRHGPEGGNLDDVKQVDAIAVSFDPVAADAWAATQVGTDPARITHFALAEKRGLGRADFKSLSPVEIKV